MNGRFEGANDFGLVVAGLVPSVTISVVSSWLVIVAGTKAIAGRNLLILLTGVLALAAIVRSQGSEAGILHAWTAARKRLSPLGEANRARTG